MPRRRSRHPSRRMPRSGSSSSEPDVRVLGLSVCPRSAHLGGKLPITTSNCRASGPPVIRQAWAKMPADQSDSTAARARIAPRRPPVRVRLAPTSGTPVTMRVRASLAQSCHVGGRWSLARSLARSPCYASCPTSWEAPFQAISAGMSGSGRGTNRTPSRSDRVRVRGSRACRGARSVPGRGRRARAGSRLLIVIEDRRLRRRHSFALLDPLQALGGRGRCQSSVMTTLPLARPCSTYARASRVWSNGNVVSMTGRRWPVS
jgi:hypothetical protein